MRGGHSMTEEASKYMIREIFGKRWVQSPVQGSGISEENQSRIFEPFFTTKGIGEGTGLGLSISYDIVENHNGMIKVDSEVGKGTFTISIPAVP
jgi:two-component system, NtrC family, sensor kinase